MFGALDLLWGYMSAPTRFLTSYKDFSSISLVIVLDGLAQLIMSKSSKDKRQKYEVHVRCSWSKN
jgi:hypothetical protein